MPRQFHHRLLTHFGSQIALFRSRSRASRREKANFVIRRAFLVRTRPKITTRTWKWRPFVCAFSAHIIDYSLKIKISLRACIKTRQKSLLFIRCCIRGRHYSILVSLLWIVLLRSALFYSCFLLPFHSRGRTEIYYQRFFVHQHRRDRQRVVISMISEASADPACLPRCTTIIIVVAASLFILSTFVDLCYKVNDVLMKGIKHKKVHVYRDDEDEKTVWT